jgi:VIT1/CCC1 family predicted Fe2+/Mn2+ transporter
MGAVGYTSTVSERDYYEAERQREMAEIEATPEAERQEIRDIYAAKGSRATFSIGWSTPSSPTARAGWPR